MATYEWKDEDSLCLKELDIYGSSRVGMLTQDILVGCDGCTTAASAGSYSTYNGLKMYELSNNLGNVPSTITDKKIYYDATPNSIADYSIREIASQQDYYPFGMLMPERRVSLSDYRFGFNGKEDDGIKGIGNSIDFGTRVYDPRLANFLSRDQRSSNYPFLSPYLYAGRNPVRYIDHNGQYAAVPLILEGLFGGLTAIEVVGSIGATVIITKAAMDIHNNIQNSSPTYLKYNEGYSWQKREERMLQRLKEAREMNHLNSMNNNINNNDDDPNWSNKLKERVGGLVAGGLAAMSLYQQMHESIQQYDIELDKKIKNEDNKIQLLKSKDPGQLTADDKRNLDIFQNKKLEYLMDKQANKDAIEALEKAQEAARKLGDEEYKQVPDNAGSCNPIIYPEEILKNMKDYHGKKSID